MALNKTIFFEIIFLLVVSLVFSQENKAYEYYDNELKIAKNKIQVEFYSILEKSPDSIKNNLITFNKNGKLRRYQRFSDYRSKILDGISEEFYEDRTVMSKRNFVNGIEDGNSVRFYENANIKADEMNTNSM